MEQNSMKAVHDAELEAETIEKNAAKEKEAVLQTARQEAAQMVAQAVATEKMHAAQSLDAARSQGEQLQAQALKDVEGEISSLHQLAESKRIEAKALVFSALV